MSEAFLSEAWIAALVDLGSALAKSDYDAIVGFEVTDAPEGGKLRGHVVFESGRIVSAEAAKSKEAQVLITLSAEMASAILSGEREWKAAYMRGDLKLGDNYELVLYRSGEVTSQPEWASFVDALRSATD